CYNHRLIYIFASSNTENYTLSLHDALPISYLADHAAGRISLNRVCSAESAVHKRGCREYCVEYKYGEDISQIPERTLCGVMGQQDRKSTRLNSSHVEISYAVFCLKKKKTYF